MFNYYKKGKSIKTSKYNNINTINTKNEYAKKDDILIMDYISTNYHNSEIDNDIRNIQFHTQTGYIKNNVKNMILNK